MKQTILQILNIFFSKMYTKYDIILHFNQQYLQVITKYQNRRNKNKAHMIEQKQIKNEVQSQHPSISSQQNKQQPSLSVPLSPDLFLFQQIVIDILNHCKRNLKVYPFDEMQVDKLVQNNKNQSIDIYQQYFLIGIGTSKTRQFICNKYEQLVRDKLINKDYLPPQMITGIINARAIGAGGNGSTASSGSNSIVGSAMNLNSEKSYSIGKLISSIICYTLQPSLEISSGLVYLLEGTRNKSNGFQFVQLMEETYRNLNQYKRKPMDRFLNHFVKNIVNQVEYHQQQYFQYEKKYLNQKRKIQFKQNAISQNQGNYKKVPSLMQESNLQNQNQQSIPQPPKIYQFIKRTIGSKRSKQDICQHPQQDAKFGKCFICQRGAGNYDKILYVPLCGMECKNKLKRINQQCLMNDHFKFMRWLLQTLSLNNNSDQVLYTLLLKQVEEVQLLTQQQIGAIIQIIVSNFSLQSIGITIGIQTIQSPTGINGNKIIQKSALVMSHIVRKYPQLMFRQPKKQLNIIKQQNSDQKQQLKTIPDFFHTKVVAIQIIRMLQSLPIINTNLQLTLLKSLMQILTVRKIKNNPQDNIIAIKQFYTRCDCQILQTNVIQRILNIISQYALYTNTSPSSSSSSNITSSQNLGSNISLGNDNNALSLGIINNVSMTGNNCSDVSISGLQEILASIVHFINAFDQNMADIQKSDEINSALIRQKKIKNYIQSKFVEQFNKKPAKAIEKIRKLFNQITPKDLAIIIKQNIHYQTKIKKVQQKISGQQVGTFFGTARKQKNKNKNKTQIDIIEQQKEKEKFKFNHEIYYEFLKLLQYQYAGRQIDDCLRITFNSFLMPKQGQQVDFVLGPLAIVLQPFLKFKPGNEASATYSLIMVALMVQTSNNPLVKQSQKLSFDAYKKMALQIDNQMTQARATQIYERIKKRPFQIMMQYKGSQVFNVKYLKHDLLKTEFWKKLQDQSILQQQGKVQVQQKPKQRNDSTVVTQTSSINNNASLATSTLSIDQTQSQNIQQKQQNNEQSQIRQNQTIQKKQQKLNESGVIQSKDSINMQSSMVYQIQNKKPESLLSFILLNEWKFVYISLVNKNNIRGLEQACILYGRSELVKQFQAFFNNLYKLHKDYAEKSSVSLQSISNQAKLIILKLAIDYSNYIIGRPSWLIIIRIIYKLDYDQQQNVKQSSTKKPQSSYSYYEQDASDKLFTRTNTFEFQRLKQFLEAMCEFSSSQAKTDRKYTRQMYILHHIAEIIQYNLQRFQVQNANSRDSSLWNVVWPTIRNYFRNICIHPRKQIAMSAIDSYKQLTMKMLKVNPVQKGHINHTQLMNVYLYVFQRSPAYIKDLIINILLNVVSRDMRSGWDQIYTILQISDSQDKEVVMKVVNRLIKDIGLKNISNLLRLHQILIKQLRIANTNSYGDIMERLWDVCDYFDRVDIWIQTLAKVKDIYKSTSDINILTYLYKICNHCIKLAYKVAQKAKKQNNKDISPQSKVDNQDQIKYQQQEISISKVQQLQNQMLQIYMNQALQSNKDFKTPQKQLKSEQIQKLIYFEVFSVQMHILEIKSSKLFADSINIFKQLNLDIFFRNLGNSQQNKTGFISLWEMFLACNNSINFCYFLHDYFALVWEQMSKIEIILIEAEQENKQQLEQYELKSIRNLNQLHYLKKQILLWLAKSCIQISKDQILQLTEEDNDLKKSFKQIIEHQYVPSGKNQLIQFYLSSKQYQAKSIEHLVFLKIFKQFYQSQIYVKQKTQINKQSQQFSIDDLNKKILQIIVDSYETASEVNSKPLLRNFLWNNQFFKGQDYLPGLMKQQLRAFQILVKYFDLQSMEGKIYRIIMDFIISFTQKTTLLSQKYSKIKPRQIKEEPKSPMKVISTGCQTHSQQSLKIMQILYQDLGLWVTNAQQLILQALNKLRLQIKSTQLNKENLTINYKQLFILCLELSQVTASYSITKQCSYVLQELVHKMY